MRKSFGKSGGKLMPIRTLEELRARVHGKTIAVHDDGYDTARKVYNGMIDRRPSAIVRCTDVADVMASVEFAREQLPKARSSDSGYGSDRVSPSRALDDRLGLDG